MGGWLLTPIPGCFRSGLPWFNWWVSFAPDFQCWYFCESSCLFYLRFIFDFCFCLYELRIRHANQTTMCLRNKGRTKGEVWSTANYLKPPVISLLAVPKRRFCLVSSKLFFYYFFSWFVYCVYLSSIVVTFPSIPAARFAFCFCFIR